MRILVTGGAGFIGSHVSDRLVSLGYQVSIVDDLSTGKRENLPPEAAFYKIDIRDKRLDDIFGAEKPQVVIHHAAHASVAHSVQDPGLDADVNIRGALNLLEACVRHQVRRVIYASTGGALYGEASYLPADESHPINPLSPYGVSKHAVEQYLFTYKHNHGLEYVVLRYPNVYGPRQDPHGEAGVVAIFARQLLKGDQPVIFGNGTKTRDYCYVTDIADANVLALNSPGTAVYNLGRGIEVTDLEIFESVREAVGCSITPIFTAKRPGEVEHIALDASKAKRELGWTWKIGLDEGIAKTVEFYRTKLEREQP